MTNTYQQFNGHMIRPAATAVGTRITQSPATSPGFPSAILPEYSACLNARTPHRQEILTIWFVPSPGVDILTFSYGLMF